MDNPTLNRLFALIEELGHTIVKAARNAGASIAAMSWPSLAVTCVMLALALTLVPLALTLFVIFMAVKLVMGAFILEKRRGKATPYKPVGDRGE